MKKQLTPFIAIFLMVFFALPRTGFAQALPTDSLALWLRSDTGVVTSLDTVLLWKDLSGNGRNASLTEGYPTLVSNVLGGHAVVHFNGIDGCMKTPAFQTFANKRGTIFVVARIDGPGSGGSGYGTIVSTYIGATYDWQFGAYPGNYGFYDGTGGSNFVVSSAPPAIWGNLTLLRQYDDSISLYKNGALAANALIDTNQPAVNQLNIGSHGEPYETLNGDIAEIIVYNRALSPAEIIAVNNYLTTKYVLPPSASGINTCSNSPVTLTATGASGYHWYATATSTTVLATGATYTTPAILATDTFYVAAFIGGTESQRIPVIVNLGTAAITVAPLGVHDITVPYVQLYGPFTNNIYDQDNIAANAFDGDTASYGWGASRGGAFDYLGYTYQSPVVLTSYGIYESCSQIGGWCQSSYLPKNWTFQGSNGNGWVTLDSVSGAVLHNGQRFDYPFTNTTAYKSYRIYITATQSSSLYPHITELYMNGADSISNTDYISASSIYNRNGSEGAFDNDTVVNGWANDGNLPVWLAYDFSATTTAQVVNGYTLYNSCDQVGSWCDNAYNPMTWRFEATNNDTTWTTLDTVTNGNMTIGLKSTYPISNTQAYKKYRIYITNSLDGGYARITEMELLQNVPLCNDSTFTATLVNAGDTPVLQWKVNGVNAGSGNALQALSGLHPGDAISCVLTATNTCQTGVNIVSNSIHYQGNTVRTVSATVCRDSVVIHGVRVHSSGTYDSTTITRAGCDSLVHYVLTVDTTCGLNGIETINGLGLNIYPNPANEYLMISCTEQIVAAQISNLIGEQVISVSGQTNRLNVSELSTGVYIIQIRTQSGKTVTRKFIKE